MFGGSGKNKTLNDLYSLDFETVIMLFTRTHFSIFLTRLNLVFLTQHLLSFGVIKMVWSRIKIRGFHPSPRAGSCGVLCGTKWYITGGGSRKKSKFYLETTTEFTRILLVCFVFAGHAETLVFDILKVEWSVASISSQSSITANKVVK